MPQIAHLIEQLSIREQVPQIEFAADGEKEVFVFRILQEPTSADLQLLADFESQSGIHVYLQPGNAESLYPLHDPVELAYKLPDYDLSIAFQPSDFTQVNAELNRSMLKLAMQLLQPDENDQVLDLFCGLGNFTLPIARFAASVTGVEGDADLVARARANAQANGLDNVCYYTANLYETLDNEPWLKQSYNKALLDPPRSGAKEILPLLPKLGVQRIVYVSCYPGTLARDAGILVNELGYRLLKVGVMDMFPHTAHVESIALFEKK